MQETLDTYNNNLRLSARNVVSTGMKTETDFQEDVRNCRFPKPNTTLAPESDTETAAPSPP
jgi:hypothetical protein